MSDTSTAPTPEAHDDTWLDTEIPQGADTFDRKYVEDIRYKAGAFRQRAHAAEERATKLEPFEVFSEFDSRDQEVWVDMAQRWRVDNRDSARVMRDIANRVLGDETPAAPAAPTAPPTQETPPVSFEPAPSMTPEKVAEIVQNAIASQAKNDQATNAVKDLNDKIASAGYAKDSRESLNVLWYLNRDPECEGDLDKALEKFKGSDQGVIDSFVAAKSGINPLPMAPGGTGGDSLPAEPRRGHEMEDARKSADAWLKSQSFDE